MPEAIASHCASLVKPHSDPASYDRQQCSGGVIDAFGRGPGLAAAWVAVKDTAENAIAAATAIMEIVVFMFRLPTNRLSFR